MPDKDSLNKYIPLQEATKFCQYSQEYLSLRARQGKLKSIKFGRNWVTKKEWLDEYLKNVNGYNDQMVSEHLPIELASHRGFFNFSNLRAGFLASLVFSLLANQIVFGKENFKNVFEVADSPIAGFGRSTDGFFADADQSIKNVFESSDSFVAKTSRAVGSIPAVDVAKTGKDFSEGVGIFTGNLTASLTYIYNIHKRSFTDVYGDLKQIDLGVAQIGEVSGRGSKNFLSWFLGQYKLANRFVEDKIISLTDSATNALTKSFQFVIAPWQNVSSKETIVKKEKETIKEVVKEVEVSKVTRIEPIREITKEVVTVDNTALGQIRAQLVDMESAISKRLYAPGGVVTQQIYLTEPVASPKVYQENGDIVLQTAGTGNVILSAATGMQISGKQVVIDSTLTSNPLVYIADRTQIAGDTSVGGMITAQRIALSASSGKVLDVQSDGSTKFSVDSSGTTTLIGDFVMTGSLSVAGNQTFTGSTVFTNSASATDTAFRITNLGSGASFLVEDSASTDATPFIIDSSGNVGIGTTTPSNIFVVGTSTELFTVTQSGSVGIGKGDYTYSSFPAHALDIMTNSSGTTPIVLALWNSATSSNTGSSIGFQNTGRHWGAFITSKAPLGTSDSSGDLLFQTRQADGTYNNFYIDINGRVGVGTTSPLSILELASATNTQLTMTAATSTFDPQIVFRTGITPASKFTLGVDQSDSNKFKISTSTALGASDILVIDPATGYLSISTSTISTLFSVATSTNIFNILSNGNVGVGTTTPSVKLDISLGNIRLSDSQNIQWGGATNFLTGSNASNFLAFITNNSERVRLDSQGYLGLGTTTPSSLLELVSATNTQLTITAATSTFDPQIVFRTGITPASKFTLGVDQSDSNKFKISTSTALGTSDILVIDPATGFLSIGTSTISTLFSVATSTNIFNILSNGNVGVGTTTPSVKLDISLGNIRLSDSQNIQWGGATNFLTGSNASNFLAFTTNNSERVRLDSQGYLGLGTTTPSSLLELHSATNTQLTITTATSTFDPQIVFRTGITPASKFTLGVDQSDSNKFKISTSTALGASDILVIDPATGFVSIGTSTISTLFSVATSTNIFNILSNGNVGVGTTTPSVKLDISLGNIRLSDSQNIQWGGATNFLTGSNASNFLAFTTNNSERARLDSQGYLGLGTTTPSSLLELHSATNTQLTITTATSTFDPQIVFRTGLAPASRFALGVDQSDSNKFKISTSTALGTSDILVIDPATGFLSIGTSTMAGLFYVATATPALLVSSNGNVGIGTTGPGKLLHIYKGASGLTPNTYVDMAIESNTDTGIDIMHPDGYSSYLTFRSATAGRTGYIQYDSTAAPAMRVGVANADQLQWTDGVFAFQKASTISTPVNTNLTLSNTGTGNIILSPGGNVGIGTTTPSSLLELSSATNTQLTITTATSTFDPQIVFRTGLAPAAKFTLGVDQSDSNKFKISTSTSLGTSDILVIDPATGFVSIGTSTISTLFSVATSTNIFNVLSNGNVGIGTTGPNEKLEVIGNISLGTNRVNKIIPEVNVNGNARTMRFDFGSSATAEGFQFYNSNAGTNLMMIQGTGNVGLGTTTPSSLLELSSATNTQLTITTATSTFDPQIVFRTGITPASKFTLGVDQSDSNKFKISTSTSLGASDILVIDPATGYLSISTSTMAGLFYVATATPALLVSSNGNVGIGTTGPKGRLNTSALTSVANMTLGSATEPGLSITSADGGAYGMYFGVFGNGNSWIQAGRTDSATAYNMSLQASGGNVGLGTTTPSSLLELASATNTQLTLTAATSTFDPQIVFRTGLAPSAKFTLGVDQSDANKFKISTSTALGTSDILVIDPATGFLSISTSTISTLFSVATSTNIFNILSNGNIGIGTTAPNSPLNIDSTVNKALALTGAGTALQYMRVTNTGGDGFWGVNQSSAGGIASNALAYATVLTSVNSTALQLGTADTIGLTIDASQNVGIGTTTPSSLLELHSATNTQLTITTATSTFDPQIVFRTGIAPAARFTLGVDQSDSNKFKISTSTALGTSDILVIDPATGFLSISTSTMAGLFYVATATPALLVSSNGNVGIGTTGPVAPLDVKGRDADNAVLAQFYSNQGTRGEFVIKNGVGTSPTIYIGNNGNNEQLAIGAGNAVEAIRITNTGLIAVGTTTSNGLFYVATSSPMLTVLQSGNVGIGTTTPSAKLDIALGNIRLSDSQNIQWGGATNFLTGSNASNFLAFTTNNSERARLDSQGYLGLGTTTPSSFLQIYGSTGSTTLTVTQMGNGAIVNFASGTASVFTLKSGNQLKYKDALLTTWGNWNDVVLDDFEDASVNDWVASTTNASTTVSATSTQAKVNNWSLAISAKAAGSRNDTATTTATTTNWSIYQRLGYWIRADYTSTSSAASSSQIISFQFYDSGGTTTNASATIQEFGRWQYEEVDLTAVATLDKDAVSWLGFKINNDYGSPVFYIDQIRLYGSATRTSEIFVDSGGNLNLVSPSKIELTRTTPGGDTLPSVSIGTAVVELNQPLAVNTGGDVGMNNDLYLANAGLSTISSAGPLTISAGNNWAYQNLTLKTGGTGDVIIDIASSTLGFKILGSATTSLGNYLFRVYSGGGAIEMGATTTLAGSLLPFMAPGSATSSSYNLGSGSSTWSNIYVVTQHVGDLIFGNQFSITETISSSSAQELTFLNASTTPILKIDENGLLTVNKIKTQELCVGSLCVNEADFIRVFTAASSSATSSAPATSTPPETIIDSGPAASTTSTEAVFTFHAEQNGTATTTATFQCKVNAFDWTNCLSPKTYPGLTPGDYTFQVFATDPLGNYDQSPASSTWTITAP